MGSSPTPGTDVIHTSNARYLRFRLLIFIVSQPEPDFEVLLLYTQLHGALCPGEYLSLVLGIAVLEHRSQVVGMVAELPECGEGAGLVRLSLAAPELLPDLSLLPLELVGHLFHELRVERDGLPGA